MGTRNLTIIRHNNFFIGKYCQWDGYPSGQGKTIISFLNNGFDREKFIANLSNVREPTENEMNIFNKLTGITDGYMNMNQVDLFKKVFPYASRDIGGDIIQLIQESTDKEILFQNSFKEFGESYIEYVYELDLNSNVLKCYSGIYLLKTFDLSNLPSTDDSVKMLEEQYIKRYGE